MFRNSKQVEFHNIKYAPVATILLRQKVRHLLMTLYFKGFYIYTHIFLILTFSYNFANRNKFVLCYE